MSDEQKNNGGQDSLEKDPKYLFMSRRQFVKGLAVGAVGGAAVAAVASKGGDKTPQPAAPAPTMTDTAPKKEEPKPKGITTPHYIAVDYEKCIGCRICEVECAMFHEKKSDLTKSRIKIYYYNPPVDIPSLCAKCQDAPCIKACPEKVAALKKDEKTGAVLLDAAKCIACWDCIEPCAKDRSGVIRQSKDGKIVDGICDLCGGDPTCVKKCPEKALSLVPAYQWGQYFAAKPEEIARNVMKNMYMGYERKGGKV